MIFKPWHSLVALLVAAAILASPVAAQDGTRDIERSAGAMVTPATQSAIDRGLDWLGGEQDDDGSFGGTGYGRNVAVVSLAGMAFLASGDTPGRGKYGANIDRCAKYVLQAGDESGFLCDPKYASHGPMYDHGFAALFLAEIYGMSPEPAIRERLARAVKLIVATQNRDGGWRYQPQPGEADISVTICQVTALRAAHNAGLEVPRETIDRCVEYVKRSQNADGGFMYMLSGGPSRFPRSAAGVVCLYSAGIYQGDEIRKGLEYLSQHVPASADVRDTHAMYGQYYAVQAMWQAGGEHWRKWYPAIRDALLKQQQADGSWMDLISPEYGTAMACIVLQVPNNCVPIFQR